MRPGFPLRAYRTESQPARSPGRSRKIARWAHVSTHEMLARERRCGISERAQGSDSVWGRTERSAGQRAFSLGRARLMHLSMEACQPKKCGPGLRR
jgi:hypothetical protein